MKQWAIDEFLTECENLSRHPYDLMPEIEAKMPEGECNGHHVKPCLHQIASIVIDHRIVNMGVINERYPNGSIVFVLNGNQPPKEQVELTGLEYVRHLLEEEVKT